VRPTVATFRIRPLRLGAFHLALVGASSCGPPSSLATLTFLVLRHEGYPQALVLGLARGSLSEKKKRAASECEPADRSTASFDAVRSYLWVSSAQLSFTKIASRRRSAKEVYALLSSMAEAFPWAASSRQYFRSVM
jgi:hypothetical protein